MTETERPEFPLESFNQKSISWECSGVLQFETSKNMILVWLQEEKNGEVNRNTDIQSNKSKKIEHSQ